MNKIIMNGKEYNRAIVYRTPIRQIVGNSYNTPIAPNVFYKLGELQSFHLTLDEPMSQKYLNEYMVEFKSGNTPTVFTYDETNIVFPGDVSIEANTVYQISIVNGIALMVGVSNE